ncbi:MAG: hypothetical protein E6K99_10215 [Thaumarchaeota archaeon]|nr:MAG: hypothetical protein E6K99_10215 [Nitrososphaerota archaeon]
MPTSYGVATGKAVWNTRFKLWQAVPANMLYPLVTEIRERRRLSPEPPNARTPNELTSLGFLSRRSSQHSRKDGLILR